MKAFWQQLDEAQQKWLMVLGVFVLLVVAYVGVWEPLSQSRDAKREEVAYHQATLNWLKEIEPNLRMLQAQRQSTGIDINQSLLSLTDQTARAAGLAGALSRIEPVNADQVNVWLDGAPFGVMMNWLSRLSVDSGVRVEELTVNRSGDQAQVDARVNLMIDR